VILAAIQKPAKIDGYYVVSGWFCDLDSCACDDHQYGGGTCKHMFAAAIWEASLELYSHRYVTRRGSSTWQSGRSIYRR